MRPDLAQDTLNSHAAVHDRTQFEAVRAERKLGDYPAPTTWTGALLDAAAGERPRGRVVCQNLGNGLSDLVVADAVWRAVRDNGVGQVVDGAAS